MNPVHVTDPALHYGISAYSTAAEAICSQHNVQAESSRQDLS